MRNQSGAIAPTDSFKAALDRLDLGDEAGAEKICSNIGPGHPDHAAARHLIGVLAYRRNALELAQKALLEAVAERPSRADYQNDLGLVYLERREHAQALKCFTQAVRLDAVLTPAYNNGGLALLAMKRPKEALMWFQRALSLDPGFVQAHLNSGLAYRDQNDMAAARDGFKSVLAINPEYAKAHFFLGDLSQSEQDLPGAIGHFQEAIRAKPDYIAAYNRLAICLAETDRFDEAIFWMSLAAQKAPRSAETFCNYGNVLRKARSFRQAAQMYRQAIDLKPDWAEAHFNLGLIQLLMGNFEQGWSEFDWRLRQFPPESGYPNRHGLPLWQGESLAGKTILVYDEQGFGDVFLFMRYLPLLKKAGARVVFETRPALIDIFKSCTHLDELVVRNPSIRPRAVCDYCIPLASLPGRLGTRLTTIPADVPYLHADPGLKARWARRMAKGTFKLGVVWSGSNVDPSRKLDLSLLAPLAEVKEIAIYGLQKLPADEASKTLSDCPWMDNLGPELSDFRDTAAVIANCNLILTIDTSVAHLAGAMAAPTWVLLPFIADWRWFLDRRDSPWYPTMRLFRQNQPRQWALPVSQVLVELKQLVAGKQMPLSSQTTSRMANRKIAEAACCQEQSLQKNARTGPVLVENRKAIESNPGEDQYLFQLAIEATERKELAWATELMRRAIAMRPNRGPYLRAFGELLLMRQSPAEALAAFEKALDVLPPSVEIHFLMAEALIQLDRKAEASEHFGRSLVLAPERPEAWFNHGVLLLQLERPEAALIALQKAVDLRPDWTAAWLNRGAAADRLGLTDQAHRCWQQVLSNEPENIQALVNLGVAQFREELFDAAAAWFEKALSHDPGAVKARMHLGLCHQRMGRVEDAVANYHQVLERQPDYAEAWLNLADALHLLDRWDDVIECYAKAIAINPKNAAAHFNLAVALRRKERIAEALLHCAKARAMDPNFSDATAYLLQLAQHACDWALAEKLAPDVDRLSAQQIRDGQKPAESPMLSLRRHADPEKNLAIAKAWSHWIDARVRLKFDRPCFKHLPRTNRQSIRIGYISNDFKEHAVAHHLLGLLRAHHRDRYRIYLYACNPEDGSEYRPKMVKACDHFVEIDRLSDTAAAQRIYDDKIDILVDLMGHTRGGRLEILAMRPAPVQVGYLGFLGSSGAAFLDYFLTDAVVTPPADAVYYTEKLVYLPDCFQVNDDRMPIAEPVDRASFGLRKDQLVLCCFNQAYKIDRNCFQAWLTILNKFPEAVLWLLRPNATARENLCRAATQAGVAADRLIFAGPLRIDRHLARLRLADLALDTFTYNGGATTANALWAGVPVLTLAGSHLVSRMSASALAAVGLPEMITHSTAEYVHRATVLLNDRSKIEAVRGKLERLKSGSSLFNPQRFSLHLEAAFDKMLARFDAGMAPAAITIESTSG